MTDAGETTARDPWAESETYKTAILRMGAERSELLDRVAVLEAQKRAALELHQAVEAINYKFSPPRASKVCAECGEDDGNWSLWPCKTVRALGAGTENQGG